MTNSNVITLTLFCFVMMLLAVAFILAGIDNNPLAGVVCAAPFIYAFYAVMTCAVAEKRAR